MMMLSKSLNLSARLSAAFAFICVLPFAQTNEDLQNYKQRYPGNNYIRSLKNQTIRIDLIKGQPSIKKTISEEFVILTTQGAQALSEDYIEFSTLEEIGDISAYSLIPQVKGSKKVPASNFKTQDVEQSGMIFHDGSKRTSMVFPSLTEGALRHLSFNELPKEYHIPFGFTFASSIPIVSSVFEIDHDTCIHLIKQEFNFKNYNVRFEEKVEKNRRIWRWYFSESPAMKTEDHAPNYNYFFPAVYAQISHYSSKAGTVNVLGSLKDLLLLYEKSIHAVLNEKLSEDLELLSAQLVEGKNAELEKVKAIYYWVQNNIKYIAFEEGINGYVPRSPNLVFEKRYGDCKDMATLIHSMLKSAGINSHLAWIGSRDLPFKYSEFPSSIADNHMIAIYFEGEKPYFLDATSSFQPIDYPTSFILGKEAFVYKKEKEYEIIQVPVLPHERTTFVDSSFISFENRRLTGHSDMTFSGYYNISINESFKDIPANKLDEEVSRYIRKGNNSLKLSNARTENVSEKDKNLKISFDFTIENYVNSFEDETYVNMIVDKDLVGVGEIKKDRTSPVEFDFLSHDQYTVSLAIPKGMKVKFIPPNLDYQSGIADLKIDYKQAGGTVCMTLFLDIKTLYIQPEDFDSWNEFIKTMTKNLSETIVLIKE